MFERIKEAFETFSQSSTLNADPTLRSFAVKRSANKLAEDIIEVLKQLKYKTIKYNDTFNEIFTSKAGYEVTIHLVTSTNGSTIIDVSVFSPENRGKTRKALRFLLDRLKKEFGEYVTNE